MRLAPNLRALEDESIFILREAMAECRRPVLLYSIGKDSCVLLHLARKSFYPAPIPFPILHVDTTWKFREMIAFRQAMATQYGARLIVHTNKQGLEAGICPFTHGSSFYTDVMKTQALRQALDKYGFDVAVGGARRAEERSRAKERVFSHRSVGHRWDPKYQRPELWSLFNTRLGVGQTLRVFPLSNWTELDIWEYIEAETISVVGLYFAKERPVVERDGLIVMVDDDRLRMLPGETPVLRRVRF